MARRGTDETLTDEAGWSRGHTEKLRFMVIGGDDDLMDKACGTMLGKREERNSFKFGELKPREAQVCGRQVSVLKTPSYWLEHLKSYLIFSNGVNSLKYELKFFESLLFPGPHAFLLVHRDVKKTGRENYLLHALSDVFGEKVLDYCMVLFIDKAWHNDPNQNYCLMMCGGRYHILQNTDESVHQLFNKTKTMTQCKSSSFFINHFDYFKKAEKYFTAEYEEKKNKLSRELEENKESAENLKKEMNDMKELHAKEVLELNERIKEDQDRENQLHNDSDALKSRENQMMEDFQKLNEELIIYKNRANELSSELDALKSSKNQTKEDLQKLKEELIIYKDRENELSNELDALKSSKNQTKEDFQKLNEELIIYKNRANELSSELDALKSSKNQTKEDLQKLKEELIIYKDRENLLLSELDALKSGENQMMVDFQKLKGELIIYKERERHLKDDKEKLQTKRNFREKWNSSRTMKTNTKYSD